MSDKPKIIKKMDKPMHPDLSRLVKSLQTLLRRRYPDPLERQVQAQKIMQSVANV